MTVLTLKNALITFGTISLMAIAPSALAAPQVQTQDIRSPAQSAGQTALLSSLSFKTDGVTKVAESNEKSRRSHSNRNRSNRHRSDRNRGRGYNHRGQSHRSVSSYRNVRPARHTSRRHTASPYQSHLGISLNFGNSARHSNRRWAPTAYSYYQPRYGHYANYQRRTQCRRVTLEAWRYGRPQLVSVKECSNPWSGTYIVQGSERLVQRRRHY